MSLLPLAAPRIVSIPETRHLVWATRSPTPPPFAKLGGTTLARRLGLQYETAWHDFANSRWHEAYEQNPWYTYREAHSSTQRWAQPDGLILLPGQRVVVVEVKRKFTRHAQKLWSLYVPILKLIYPSLTVSGLLVVNWFDPAESGPIPFFVGSPEHAAPDRNNVFSWKPPA